MGLIFLISAQVIYSNKRIAGKVSIQEISSDASIIVRTICIYNENGLIVNNCHCSVIT